MKVPPSRAAAWSRLLAWDAPCLPEVRVEANGAGATVETVVPEGETLKAAGAWLLTDRIAAALQLVCAVAFLHERGWYPSRHLLRGARARRCRDWVSLRLAELPEATLEDRLPRRVGSAAGDADVLVEGLLRPLLDGLVPELRDALTAAVSGRPVWEAANALIGALLDHSGHARALRHPAGAGRALWSRRWVVPTMGAGWVACDDDARRLAAAAVLAATGQGRRLSLLVSEVDEDELLQHLARTAAAGLDGVVITTLSSPSAPPVLLDGDERALWVLGPDVERGAAWVRAAVREAGDHPVGVDRALKAGATRAFTSRPRVPAADRSAERLVTPAARRCLDALRSAPAGLTGSELHEVVGAPRGALVELHRACLVRREAGAWVASAGAHEDPRAMREVASRLAPESPRRLVADVLAGESPEGLVAWCDRMLDARRPSEVLQVVRPAVAVPALACRCAEAALQRGLGLEAEAILEGVPRHHRDAHWHAVSLWRQDLVGALPVLDTVTDADLAVLPGRLVCRVELMRSRAARLAADRVGERAALQRAVAAAGGSVPEAEILLAATGGRAELRTLRRRRRGAWSGEARAALLHETAYRRLEGGAWAAAATGFRAALRSATGSNLELLGRIHTDLGGVSILLEQPVVADRHLHLAERIFARSGSRRSLTAARKNRAALACDRLDWRLASRLLEEAAVGEEAPNLLPAWLDELQRIYIELARGHVEDVKRRLPEVEERLEPALDRSLYAGAVAGVRTHVALTEGDLVGARRHAGSAEAGDRRLFAAVIRAEAGDAPPAGLPNRWGMATTARLLAGWRVHGQGAAAAILVQDSARAPLEAAVGLARFVTLLGASGERLGGGWSERCADAARTLREAGLDGWAERLAAATIGGVVEVVQALDRMLNAGTDALNADRLAGIGRAVGLSGLQVWRDGELAGSWGEASAEAVGVAAAGVEVRGVGRSGAAVEAVCRLLARNLAARPVGPDEQRTVGGTSLVGRSEALEAVRAAITRWARLDAPVLVLGEPGTGKELVAREIHRQSGRRGALVPVNCAGVPAPLMEAELFGAIRGAYTGADRDRIGLVEAAEGGTLHLDEIGDMPLEVQAKLLRLLQEREVRRVGATRTRKVDVRFVAATNQDLDAALAARRFRGDLYYRLNVAVIRVPPLRDRLEDVEDLAPLFTRRCAVEYARPGVTLAPESIPLLQRHRWPGNVRELEQVIRRAVAAASPGETLGPDRFEALGRRKTEPVRLGSWAAAQEEHRRTYFAELLRACGGNRSEAARRAGISRQTLLYHLRALGLGGQEDG